MKLTKDMKKLLTGKTVNVRNYYNREHIISGLVVQITGNVLELEYAVPNEQGMQRTLVDVTHYDMIEVA